MGLLVTLASASVSAEGASEANKRNPKLFFVSSTTTTVSTTTICYVSSGTPSTAAACGKRKRRALMVDSLTGKDTNIEASGVTRTEKEESSPEVESTKDEQAREGKFLMYWMTTTSTSTTYTTTTTISSLACTPSGFTISNCTG